MTARLDVFNDHAGYVIAWDDEGCPGLRLGESLPRGSKDPDHTVATDAARASGGRRRPSRRGQPLVWEEHADAVKALRAARAAMRAARANTPWPTWALKAKAEGWSPPRGWKPNAEDSDG